MEEGKNAGVGIGDVGSHWWWGLASTGQLGWGISASRRVCNYRLVPYKALGVATLFVGAGASAFVSVLHACGIRTVKDIQELSRKTKGCITVRDESESVVLLEKPQVPFYLLMLYNGVDLPLEDYLGQFSSLARLAPLVERDAILEISAVYLTVSDLMRSHV